MTAQKINTAIDVCVIGGDCGLLQQGADISGGYYRSIQDVRYAIFSKLPFGNIKIYLSPQICILILYIITSCTLPFQVSQLLQSLILMYQPDISVRKRLNAPPPDTVDYRAACFCHRTLVDMGNVCSNCLSVYCKAVPLCSTCNVIFQIDRPLMKLPKKKK